MRTLTTFEQKFPKFLIGDSADDRIFVIHLHHPRFIGEVTTAGLVCAKIDPEFIDPPTDLKADEMATLMRQAGDFYLAEIERE